MSTQMIAPTARNRAAALLELRRRKGLTVNYSSDNPPYLELYNALHPGQREIADSPARFKVVVCGRRWGKTEFGKQQSISLSSQGKHVWWILPDYPMAVDVWHDIKRTFNGDWVEKQESQHIIRTKSGGILRIRSASDIDRLKGSGLDHAIFDETASTRRDIWLEAIRPALSDKLGSASFLGTPKGVMNWFYELFQKGIDPNETDWASWNFPTWTNPYIRPEEIEAARGSMPQNVFDQEYGAKFTSNAGIIYDNFDMTSNVTTDAEYNPDLPVQWGVDDGYAEGRGFGTDSYHPRVVLLTQQTPDGGINVFAEYYKTHEADYLQSVDNVLALGYPKPDIAYIDSSAAMFKANLWNRGITTFGATHTVIEGIRNVRRMIQDVNGKVLLRIHPRCVQLIKEMLLYIYQDGTSGIGGEPKPAKLNDHGPDCLRYRCWSLRYGGNHD